MMEMMKTGVAEGSGYPMSSVYQLAGSTVVLPLHRDLPWNSFHYSPLRLPAFVPRIACALTWIAALAIFFTLSWQVGLSLLVVLSTLGCLSRDARIPAWLLSTQEIAEEPEPAESRLAA